MCITDCRKKLVQFPYVGCDVTSILETMNPNRIICVMCRISHSTKCTMFRPSYSTKLPRFSCHSTKYHVSLMPFCKKYYVSLMPVHKVPCFTHAIPSFIIATPQKYHECFKHAIPKKDHVLRIPHFTHFAFLQSAMFRSCHSTVLFFRQCYSTQKSCLAHAIQSPSPALVSGPKGSHSFIKL